MPPSFSPSCLLFLVFVRARYVSSYWPSKHVNNAQYLALQKRLSYLQFACLTAWYHCAPTLCARRCELLISFLSYRCKIFPWFHFSRGSFLGCHYKLCFLLEKRCWIIFHYIYLWTIVQSVWCQSPFQFLSHASPSCLAPFLTPSHDTIILLLVSLSQPHIPSNSLTSLAVHMKENIPFIRASMEGWTKVINERKRLLSLFIFRWRNLEGL